METEKDMKDRSGLYGYTQRAMAYNSNKIEGSTLTEDQTASLFEEGYLPATDSFYKTKDVEEMTGHFLMFNKMLLNMAHPLSEELIKELHFELKAGVFEDRANGYAIGDYKKRANTVGNLDNIALPAQVPERMKELLEWYLNVSEVNLIVLAEFHERYELIHPFQDGNGRTGRIILFRECLEHNLMPFIIHNDNRTEYIESLKIAHMTKKYDRLADLFKKEQEAYKDRCEFFDVWERYNECVGLQSVDAASFDLAERKQEHDIIHKNRRGGR